VGRDNILTPLTPAFIRAFTPSTIASAFRKTGIWPYNPSEIHEDLIAPSRETGLTSHLPLPIQSPIKRIADSAAVQHALRSSSPIHVFYTPTKTRTLPIDPSIIAAAELRSVAEADPSLSFLTSDSPIRSSSSLPRLNFIRIDSPHLLIEDFLKEEPATEQAYRFQIALRESKNREFEALRTLTFERTCLILAELHCKQMKSQLYAKEEKRNKTRERLTGDGLARVLTHDAFIQLVREHREVQVAAEADKQKREKERIATERLKAAWKEEQEKINQMNAMQGSQHQEELTAWEAERDLAKQEKRRPAWNKPKKPTRIPSLPKTWVKSRPPKAPAAVGGTSNSVEGVDATPDDEMRASDEESDSEE
jgi:hypothetical protein